MGFQFIIEHMEEDDETTKAVPPWVLLEYSHMRTLAGPDGHIHFTHLSPSAGTWLNEKLSELESDGTTLAKASVHQSALVDILDSKLSTSLDRVCLLDPKAKEGLEPEDGDGRFDCFLFGDDPPRDRTSELRVLGFPSRHLGPVQMTTDTALGVTKLVVQDGTPLDKIRYVVGRILPHREQYGFLISGSKDMPTIRFNSKESVEMPFRYIAMGDGCEPILPPGMKELLHEDLNKSFEF